MYITCTKSTANFKLIDQLIVSPNTSTMATYANWTTETGSFWIEAAIDWLIALKDGIISVECRHTNGNSYMQI
jgi:hypothetical protein